MRFQFQNMKKSLKAELTTEGPKELLIKRDVQAMFFSKTGQNFRTLLV